MKLWRLDTICIAILTTALVVYPLFQNHPMPTDWRNHQWLADYFTSYFWQHFRFPEVINTVELIGIPFPLFYGVYFYPLTAVLGGMSVVISLVTFLQIVATANLVYTITRHRWMAMVVGVLGIWSIYALTNLYNRGAVTEYIANALQMIALCAFLSWALPRSYRPISTPAGRSHHILIVFGFLLAFLGTTHPISGLLTLFLLMPLSLIALYRLRSSAADIRGLYYGIVIGLLLVAPWAYAYFQFGRFLDVAVGQNGLHYFNDSIDQLLTRLSLLPSDPRLQGLTPGQKMQVSTPQLDAQANMPFLILALGVLLFNSKTAILGLRRWGLNIFLSLLGLVIFFLSLYVSVNSALVNVLPDFIQKQIFMIQFSYRLTAYCSLGLFLFLVGILRAAGPLDFKSSRAFAAWIAVTMFLAAAGLFLKQRGAGEPSREVAFVELPFGSSGIYGAAHLPKSFYGAFNYSTPTLFETYRLPVIPAWPIAVPAGGAASFGEPGKLFLDERMVLPMGYMLKTNVMAFPWNRLTLEGVEVPTKQFQKVLTVAPKLGRLGYEFKSPAIFNLLRRVGQISFFGVLLWTVLGLVPWAHYLRALTSKAGYQQASKLGFLQTLRAKVFQNSK